MTTTTPLSAASPWLQVWIRPRATIRELLGKPSGLAVWFLPVISGIGQSMVQGAQNNVGAKGPLLMLLSMSVLVGAIWGLLQIHVLALLLYLIGRVTNGPATFRQVRMVIAWAEVPHVVLVACWWLGAVIFGRLFFLNPEALGLNPPPALMLGMLFVYLVSVICVSWSFVLLVKSLAEVQGISAWQALGSLLLAGLCLGVAALIVLPMVLALTR